MSGGWVPTLPRQRIAAMYNGPGPGEYLLPGSVGVIRSDPRKRAAPSFSFGTKHAPSRTFSGPGPCYLPNSRITRVGMSGEPHYSLHGRPKELVMAVMPGPGTYSPENGGQGSYKRAASFSFGSRTKGNRQEKIPAPNCYSLPELIGGKSITVRSAPHHSMTGRSKIGSCDEDLSKTPGPGTYKMVSPDVYKNRCPHITMSGRNPVPGDTTIKPGPGAHSPEKVHVTKRLPPSFSFGIRHTEFLTPFISEPSN